MMNYNIIMGWSQYLYLHFVGFCMIQLPLLAINSTEQITAPVVFAANMVSELPTPSAWLSCNEWPSQGNWARMLHLVLMPTNACWHRNMEDSNSFIHYVPSVVSRSAVMDLHRSRSCATLIQSLYDIFVHSLMLSVHIVLSLPRPLLPSILPSISNRCTPFPLIVYPKCWHFLWTAIGFW